MAPPENTTTLNDIAGDGLVIVGLEGIAVKKEFEQNMPPVSDDGSSIWKAICHLGLEITAASPTKVIYKTRIEGNAQKIEMYRDGKPMPDDALQFFKYLFDEIARRKTKWPCYTRDCLIAAQYLQDNSGRICLENLASCRYTVRITVEIPLPAQK